MFSLNITADDLPCYHRQRSWPMSVVMHAIRSSGVLVPRKILEALRTYSVVKAYIFKKR